MTPIIRDVSDLGDDERRAFELVLGQPLRDDQQIVLGVRPSSRSAEVEPAEQRSDSIPDWWQVYAGLSDAEIDQLDAPIRQRADFTRAFGE
ncbi:MAG: hypothetical protein SGJ19_12320 [Planctomycetia bacterium]|nr:hypothetical protein [Planctomycetia bacterium]